MSITDERRDPYRPTSQQRTHRPLDDQRVEPSASADHAMNAPDNGGRPSVLERAFQMLELVASGENPLNLTEMSRAAGLPLPTTYRFAKALVKLRALEKDEHGRYTLGPVWSEWSDVTAEQDPTA